MLLSLIFIAYDVYNKTVKFNMCSSYGILLYRLYRFQHFTFSQAAVMSAGPIRTHDAEVSILRPTHSKICLSVHQQQMGAKFISQDEWTPQVLHHCFIH